MKRFTLALLACLASASAFAVPIQYTTLQNNVASFGEISPSANWYTPATAQYFSFYANGGQQVTITGTRIDGGYDMGFWLFAGLFNDTNQFGSVFDLFDTGFIALRDDQIAPPPPGGPFADPQFVATLNAGWYTVAVTNFDSIGDPGPDNMYDFRLLASNVAARIPEPAPLVLVGFGLLAVAFARRR